MFISNKYSTFRRYLSGRFLYLELLSITIGVEFALRMASFDRVNSWLKLKTHDKRSLSNPNRRKLKQIRYHLKNIRNSFPFIKCYNQALTARIALHRRNYKSTLFLGFKKDQNTELEGHAWLSSHDIVITGRKGRNKYKVIATYE